MEVSYLACSSGPGCCCVECGAWLEDNGFAVMTLVAGDGAHIGSFCRMCAGRFAREQGGGSPWGAKVSVDAVEEAKALRRVARRFRALAREAERLAATEERRSIEHP